MRWNACLYTVLVLVSFCCTFWWDNCGFVMLHSCAVKAHMTGNLDCKRYTICVVCKSQNTPCGQTLLRWYFWMLPVGLRKCSSMVICILTVRRIPMTWNIHLLFYTQFLFYLRKHKQKAKRTVSSENTAVFHKSPSPCGIFFLGDSCVGLLSGLSLLNSFYSTFDGCFPAPPSEKRETETVTGCCIKFQANQGQEGPILLKTLSLGEDTPHFCKLSTLGCMRVLQLCNTEFC